MKTNNITRMLDAKKIPYTVFELPAEKIGAVEAARILNVPPALVYKTIVIKREGKGKPILAVIPGPNEVDLKALAKCLGEKKLIVPTQREAERITGLLAGGISPLPIIHKGFQTVLDESARRVRDIYVSGGQRGLNIRLSVDDLLALTGADIHPIVI